MKVSVVLPAWKGKFLREAIGSILAQTFSDFELLVVDDCSPEDIRGIVNSFSDSRIHYSRNEQNIGGRDLAAAWNKAMENARGEYAVLASDDDLYEEEFLSTLVALADEHKDISIFHSRVAFIDSAGSELGLSEERPEYETPAEFLFSRAVKRNWQFAPEFLFRVDKFRAIGGFVSFPRAWYSDDATWLKLAFKGGVIYSPRVLFRWRKSRDNISSLFSDLEEKLKAGFLYKRWIHEYINNLTAEIESKENRKLLKIAESKVDGEIDHMSFWLLHNATFGDSLRAFRHIEGGIGAKAAFAYSMIKIFFKRLFALVSRRSAR